MIRWLGGAHYEVRGSCYSVRVYMVYHYGVVKGIVNGGLFPACFLASQGKMEAMISALGSWFLGIMIA